MRVDIHGFKFDVSDDEFQYLMRVPEEDRFFTLCCFRYEHHVLSKQGTKKVPTMEKMKARQAIRFALAFVRHGQGGLVYEKGDQARNTREIPESSETS